MPAKPETVRNVVLGAVVAVATAGSSPWWWDKVGLPWGSGDKGAMSRCNGIWLSSDAFADCFEAMRSSHLPSSVQGKLDEQRDERYWAKWGETPNGLGWLMCSRLYDDGFAILSERAAQLDGTMVSHSSFLDAAGNTKHQAVWVKSGQLDAWWDAMGECF